MVTEKVENGMFLVVTNFESHSFYFLYISSLSTVWTVFLNVPLFKEAMLSERMHRMYVTTIQGKFDCEVFFPSFDESDFNLVM